MATALYPAHERHSLGADVGMKKGPKMGKLGVDASSDLRVLKRKSMSLNHDSFAGTPAAGGVSVDLAKLSREQRVELRKKLKRNIEEVRVITSKIESRLDAIQKVQQQTQSAAKSSHSGDAKSLRGEDNGLGRKDGASVVSDPASSSGETPRDMPKEMSQREARLARQPSVVVPEASAGTPGEKMKRTPKANPAYVNDEFVSGKDRMPPPEKAKSKKAGSLGGQGRDPRRQKVDSARAKRMVDMLKQCTTLLRKLMTHKHGWVFNDAVDAEKLGLHDYHAIIKKPMDLGTVKKRLHLKQYPTPAEFAADIELTFQNAMTYNPVGHDVYVMAELLRGIYDEWWRNMSKKLDEERRRVDREEEMLANDEDSVEEAGDVRRGERDLHSLTRGKSSSRLGGSQPKPRPDDIGKRPMTFEEKRKLSVNLERLPGDKLERIVQIIKKRNPDLGQNEDEIEVDIDSFDNETLWELDRFVTNYMKSKGKKSKSKGQHGEYETGVAPGNAGRKSRQGGDVGEKDVDIDDDLAPTKFAPVVIDKGRDSSSSGSESSDSGSSDSDSDSGSSSGSESDAEEGQTGGAGPKSSNDKSIADCPPQPLQDPVGTDPVSEPKDGPGPVEEALKKDDAVMHEEAASERPVVQEKSPPARQVSPEKQLRAALLKGRFADLIVKSQEKSLPDNNKNDKVDPEKLKRDREEMERRQRDEKARLHAEAKAAEATKRKAEEVAALLEKQKREVERDEARRALQRMERTVEIDENSAILSDLERLRSGPLESMLGSAHDAGDNEEGSPDGSSTIAIQGGSNPLEQLGLFMRNDDEDDEPHDDEDEEMVEGESAEAVKADAGGDEDEAVDVEDGEIDVD